MEKKSQISTNMTREAWYLFVPWYRVNVDIISEYQFNRNSKNTHTPISATTTKVTTINSSSVIYSLTISTSKKMNFFLKLYVISNYLKITTPNSSSISINMWLKNFFLISYRNLFTKSSKYHIIFPNTITTVYIYIYRNN